MSASNLNAGSVLNVLSVLPLCSARNVSTPYPLSIWRLNAINALNVISSARSVMTVLNVQNASTISARVSVPNALRYNVCNVRNARSVLSVAGNVGMALRLNVFIHSAASVENVTMGNAKQFSAVPQIAIVLERVCVINVTRCAAFCNSIIVIAAVLIVNGLLLGNTNNALRIFKAQS